MARRVTNVDPRTVPPDTPMRLDVIAAAAFPDGSVTGASLRREASKGTLEVWQIAGKYMTTMNAIQRMVERCRVKDKRPDYGSAPRPQTARLHDASRADQAALAQAALLLKIEMRSGLARAGRLKRLSVCPATY